MPITVVTWNMQGGTNFPGVSQLRGTFNPDVICLQETGNLQSHMTNIRALPTPPNAPGSVVGRISIGRREGLCVFWPNAAETRLGMAIVCFAADQGHGIEPPAPAPRITPRYPRGLPWVEVRDPASGRSTRIYSVHAPSAGAARASNWNNAQIPVIASHSTNWAMVGDFNADPDDDRTEPPVQGVWVSSPNATQQSGNTLDYIIANTNAVRIEPIGPVPMSDHLAQGFNIHV